jgi:hypothetical protein
MNKIKKNISKIIAVLMLTAGSFTVSAQPPPPPSGSNGGGNDGNKLGGNAPIGGGLFILLGLGAVYGGRKLYQLKAEEQED